MARRYPRINVGGVTRIMPLSIRTLVAGLARIPLKYRIPVVIVLAGAAILYGCSQDAGASSAVHVACKGFRQWQRTHDTATLKSATNGLDSWVQANNSNDRSDAFRSADAVDSDMYSLLLGVQKVFPDENVPADTQQVVSDCKGK